MSTPPLPALPAEPRPGRYRHYKGKDYEVVGIARHSETEEVVVVYRPLYGARELWIRPHAMFIEHVAGPQPGTTVPRFAYVSQMPGPM